ncbi:hypothetical protein [Haloferula sp.]|uniref:hypothetical protein n=1 Tax=Haloferula sp. TaxID=2497595 RepID=UPI003C735CD8
MSKKQRRLESLAENVNKRRPEKKTPPATLTVWEKILIFGTIAFPLLLLVGIYVRSSVISYDKAIRQRVESWKTRHNLTQSQIDELIEIELNFHRHERPFSVQRVPSSHEIDEHRKTIKERLAGSADDH